MTASTPANPSPSEPLQPLIDQFLAEFDAAPATIRVYQQDLRTLLRYDIPIDNDTLRKLHTRLMTDPRGYTWTSRNTKMVGVRRFLKWLDARGLMPPGHSAQMAEEKLRTVRSTRKPPYEPRIPDPDLPRLLYFFTPGEEDTPIQRQIALRNNALVQVLFSTAARCGEVASLTRVQVGNGRFSEVPVKGKGGRTRTLFFNGPARGAIKAYLAARGDKNPLLFVSHVRGREKCPRPISVTVIETIIKEAARTLGLQANTCPHIIRHYIASDMLHRGLRLEMVQQVLGHTNIAVTRLIYAHTDTGDLRKSVEGYWRATGRVAHDAIQQEQPSQ